MSELIKFEVVELPKLLLVGKEIRYSMEEQMTGQNRLPAFWGACFAENIFAPLEAQAEQVYDPAYVGVMVDWDRGDGEFSYIVGMLMKEGAAVPEGYQSRELDACRAAVGWIKGVEAEVYQSAHSLTEHELRGQGYTGEKMRWCMELYNCPRFTQPDENGEIILDYYIPIDAA
jgi:predicted transcriptional regulator YdeE